MDYEVDSYIKILEYKVKDIDGRIVELQYLKEFYLSKIEKLKRG